MAGWHVLGAEIGRQKTVVAPDGWQRTPRGRTGAEAPEHCCDVAGGSLGQIKNQFSRKGGAIAYRMLLILYIRDHLWNFHSKAAKVATKVSLVVNCMHDFT